MGPEPRVFVSAGELSGDQILGDILRPLRARFPGMVLGGLGGPFAAACGLAPLFPLARTAISGGWDVIRNAAFALRMYRAAARELERMRPQLALLVDYPGLNLRLAERARNLGVPVVFVAPPQAWAYRLPARKLRRAQAALRGCHIHVLFPFEAEGFAAVAGRLTAGHFFAADRAGADRRAEPGRQDAAGPGRDRLCLCPGSRLPVLRRNLPAWLDMLAAADRLAPATEILVPEHLRASAREILASHAGGRYASRVGLRTDKDAALSAATHAIAFPGTITLELALRRVPTVVIAILDPLTLALGRRALGPGARLALPNLLSGEALFPEWAGTRPGPEPERYLELEKARDRAPEWGTGLEKLAARMGPGTGADTVAAACGALLGGPAGEPAVPQKGHKAGKPG